MNEILQFGNNINFEQIFVDINNKMIENPLNQIHETNQ